MPRDVLIQPLRHLPILQGLTAMQITEIARHADRIVYKPGEAIMVANRPADGAIVIVAGEAERISGPGVGQLPETIPAGAMLAEAAMLVETLHSSTIIARSQVRALKLTREELHRQMAEDPSIAEQLLGRLSQRLGQLAREMREIDSLLAGESSAMVPVGTPAGSHGPGVSSENASRAIN